MMLKDNATDADPAVPMLRDAQARQRLAIVGGFTALVGAATYLLGTILSTSGSTPANSPFLTLVGFGSANSYVAGSLLIYWPPAFLVLVGAFLSLVRGRNLLLGGGLCLAAGLCSLSSMLALLGFFHQVGQSTPVLVATAGALASTTGGALLVVAGRRTRWTES
jgi:hypothetical protein